MSPRPRTIVFADDRALPYRTLLKRVEGLDQPWKCRWADPSQLAIALREGGQAVDLDTEPVDWDDVLAVITDTHVGNEGHDDALVMRWAGIELALRVAMLQPDHGWINVIGYSGQARQDVAAAMRVAWAATGNPFIQWDDLTAECLADLLSDERTPEELADRYSVRPSDDDWRLVGLEPPSTGATDPYSVGDALRLALTEAGREEANRGDLWRMIATGKTDEQAGNSSRLWARENLGRFLGTPPDGASQWSYPRIAGVIRTLAGFPPRTAKGGRQHDDAGP